MSGFVFWPDEYAEINLKVTISEIASDPTSLVALLRDPLGNITEYTYGVSSELSKNAVGDYTLRVEVSEPGEWWVRFRGTGVAVGAEEDNFRVRQGHF